MNNADVSSALREIAELLELKNESSFRIRAYENAGRTVGDLTEDVRTLRAEGRLRKQKGIGEGIAQKIDELLDTGKIQYLEDLRREYPEGVVALMRVPGVGPSIARKVYHELGVANLEELRQAAEDGRLSTLPGMGEKSAQNVLRALGRVSKQEARISIGRALPLVEEISGRLRAATAVDKLQAAGSLRRWAPTIGDIDLMATAGDPDAVMDAFVSLPIVAQILGHGHTKSAIVTDSGLQVDLRIVEADSWGALLQHFTGSRDHNIELREYALSRGQSLNEYGILSVQSQELQRFADEDGFYAALDLPWIPPELRQGNGEIAAARRRELPQLIEVGDIKGELHMHTEWSDGTAEIEEMVSAARGHGYQYVAITDHSGGIGVAHGLSIERLREQWQAIRAVAERVTDIRILLGSEVDIRRDGSLDFPDEILAELDWVIASVHSGFNQPEAEMTARIIRAMENPHVDAIAHPTGRIIGKRAPYEVDLEAVFRAAARTGTALEINSFPERLDLTDTHVRRARELGARIVVDTDAHAPANLDNIRYGVAMARRGWCTPDDVINAWPLERLEAWLRRASPAS